MCITVRANIKFSVLTFMGAILGFSGTIIIWMEFGFHIHSYVLVSLFRLIAMFCSSYCLLLLHASYVATALLDWTLLKLLSIATAERNLGCYSHMVLTTSKLLVTEFISPQSWAAEYIFPEALEGSLLIADLIELKKDHSHFLFYQDHCYVLCATTTGS